MLLFTICIIIHVRPFIFLYAIPYAWYRRRAVCSFVFLKPRFCIKMHVTKYRYNELGPMVPWVSLYTKFTVHKLLFCLGLVWPNENAWSWSCQVPGTWSHLWFAGVRECPPWCSVVGAAVTVHQFLCILLWLPDIFLCRASCKNL